MSISVSAIKTAFENLGVLYSATRSASNAIADLGPRPTYPISVSSDSDYNDVTAAIAEWDTLYNDATASYRSCVNAQIESEKEVVALMPPSQWVAMREIVNWDYDNLIIGVKDNRRSNTICPISDGLFLLVVTFYLSVQHFPNV